MEEKKKHKVMIGIEVILLGMIIAIVGTNAASSNPPSNGVSYSKNNQTTVEGALNDLYNKANYGNASAGQILSGKTALVGGNKITGSMTNKGAVTKTVNPGGTYTIPAGYHNGSGKVTASTCPTCIGGSDKELSATQLTYVENMTLEAGKFYLIEARALSKVNGAKPTINIIYENSENVTILVNRDYGPNHNAVYTHYVFHLVKVKQSTKLKKISISNTFSTGSTSRIVTRLDP